MMRKGTQASSAELLSPDNRSASTGTSWPNSSGSARTSVRRVLRRQPEIEGRRSLISETRSSRQQPFTIATSAPNASATNTTAAIGRPGRRFSGTGGTNAGTEVTAVVVSDRGWRFIVLRAMGIAHGLKPSRGILVQRTGAVTARAGARRAGGCCVCRAGRFAGSRSSSRGWSRARTRAGRSASR